MKVVKNPITIDAVNPASFARAGTAWYWDYAGNLQSAGTNVIRLNWNKETHAFEGMLLEPAATNLFTNNATVSTRTGVTVANASYYTLSFYGDVSGNSTTITLSGAATGTLTSNGAGKRVTKLIGPTSGTSLTMTVSGSGTGTYGQLELGLSATSVIPTAGSAVTRPADVVTGTGLLYVGFTDATAAYAAGTTYALGAVVQYGGRLYESLQASNTGHTPSTSPTWWLDTDPTNVTAAFDLTASTKSTGAGPDQLVCLVLPSSVDTVVCANLTAYSTNVVIAPSALGGVSGIYTSGSPRLTWNKAAAAGSYVTIIISSDSGVGGPYADVSIGEIVAGIEVDLGGTNYGMSTRLIDFSKKNTDAYGKTTFVKGANSKRVSATANVAKAQYATVMNTLTDLLAVPTAWKATDDSSYDTGSAFAGFLNEASIAVNYPDYSLLRLEFESLL